MEPFSALMFPVRLARTNCWTNGPFADDLRHQTLMTSQQCYNYITSYGSPWITLFGHEWGDLPMTFTSEAAISENQCRIASRVTQKLLFKINRTLSHSWHVIFTAGTVDYVFIYTETFFWPSIVMSPQLTRGVTKTRGTGTVTSYPSIVAHTNWRKVDIHQWITTDLSPPPGIHGVACKRNISWWRHQMEALSALLALCAGNSPVTSEFPVQRPVTRSFDVFFDLRLE